MSANSPVYNDTNFREQFPEFESQSSYPPASLQFAWNMGSNWIVQSCSASWGLGSNTQRWQQAADLMGAVVVKQLYGKAAGAQGQKQSQAGETAGPVQSATEGSVSVSFKLPEFGSSAFKALLLSTPPYGTMLLALLEIASSVGPYIGSGRARFSRVPP